MICVWVHGCDPGRVSDGSRLALYQTLSIECPSSIFSGMCFALVWGFIDIPLIFSCPADDVPDWQPRIIHITGYV